MLRIIFLVIIALTTLAAGVEGRPRSTRNKRFNALKYYRTQMKAHFGHQPRSHYSKIVHNIGKMLIRRRNNAHKLFY